MTNVGTIWQIFLLYVVVFTVITSIVSLFLVISFQTPLKNLYINISLSSCFLPFQYWIFWPWNEYHQTRTNRHKEIVVISPLGHLRNWLPRMGDSEEAGASWTASPLHHHRDWGRHHWTKQQSYYNTTFNTTTSNINLDALCDVKIGRNISKKLKLNLDNKVSKLIFKG